MATLRTEPSRAGAPRAVVPRLPAARPLNPLERARLAREIVGAYLLARRELRRHPIEAAMAALRAQFPTQAMLMPADLVEAARLGRAVGMALRLLPGDTRCLARSLVLTRLLARREIPARLVIGVRSEPEFLAHAWVECDRHPVLPPGEDSFGRLVEL